MANDVSVGFDGAGGYLDMNVNKPMMIFNIMHSMTIISDRCIVLAKPTVLSHLFRFDADRTVMQQPGLHFSSTSCTQEAPDGPQLSQGRDGDRINAVLAAAGYNFSLLLRWLERLLCTLMRILLTAPAPAHRAKNSPRQFFTDD